MTDMTLIHGPAATPLRLIHAHDPAAGAGKLAAPRVLSDEVLARLTALNAAVRSLRAMGIRVRSTRLDGEFPADIGEPSIRIERNPAVSLAPLLDAAGPRSYWRRYVRGAEEVTAFCVFQGCVVLWEERP